MFLAAKPIFPGSVRWAFTVSNVFAFWNITLRSSRGYLKGVLHLELSTDILKLKPVIIHISFYAVIFRIILVHFRISVLLAVVVC